MTARSNWLRPLSMRIAPLLALGLVSIGVVVFLPDLMSRCTRSNCRRTVMDVTWIMRSAAEFAAHHDGHYPKNLDEFFARDELGRKYLDVDEWPLDPWGHPYVYEPPTENETEPHVFTLGADGEVGGTGDDEDVVSRTLLMELDSR